MGGWRGVSSFICILKKKKRKTIADSQNEKLALCLKFKLLTEEKLDSSLIEGKETTKSTTVHSVILKIFNEHLLCAWPFDQVQIQ